MFVAYIFFFSNNNKKTKLGFIKVRRVVYITHLGSLLVKTNYTKHNIITKEN